MVGDAPVPSSAAKNAGRRRRPRSGGQWPARPRSPRARCGPRRPRPDWVLARCRYETAASMMASTVGSVTTRPRRVPVAWRRPAGSRRGAPLPEDGPADPVARDQLGLGPSTSPTGQPRSTTSVRIGGPPRRQLRFGRPSANGRRGRRRSEGGRGRRPSGNRLYSIRWGTTSRSQVERTAVTEDGPLDDRPGRPEMFTDPFPRYAELRRRRVGVPGLLQADAGRRRLHAHPPRARPVAAQRRPFLKRPHERGSSFLMRHLPKMFRLLTSSMVYKDDPDHARLRRLVNKAFTPAWSSR